MQTQRINITLPNNLVRDLRRIIPARSRSKFIASAVSEKLSKKDLKDSLRKSGQAQREIIQQMQEDFKDADIQALSNLP